MANQVIKNPKEFDQNIRVMLTTDPAHADTFNPLLEKLINNDAYLKDGIDSLDSLKPATGTATNIQLNVPNMITYSNLRKITFVAAISNAGAATTINVNGLGAKSLYKPNTTTAPNLTAGKAYEVWYSQTNNCFFVKASAEGTAQAQHVLAPYTISNDEDTGVVGTMVNRGSIGTVNLTAEGAEYTIAQGFHNGLGKVKAVIAGLIASVIKAGTNVGGIIGTFTSDATAVANDIRNGKSAYVNGAKIAGNLIAKRYVIGTGTTAADGLISVSGLPFQPSYIIVDYTLINGLFARGVYNKDNNLVLNSIWYYNSQGQPMIAGFAVTSSGFSAKFQEGGNSANRPFNYIAFE